MDLIINQVGFTKHILKTAKEIIARKMSEAATLKVELHTLMEQAVEVLETKTRQMAVEEKDILSKRSTHPAKITKH